MEQVLTRYVRALRAAGAAVSPSEAIDAAQAVSVVGWADRGILKDALSAVLVKNQDEREIHDRLFDIYFSPRHAEVAPPEAESAASSDDQNQTRPQDGAGEGYEEQDPFQRLMSLAQQAGGDASDAAMQRAANAAGVDDIRFASQASYFTRRMLETMGIEALEARISQALDQKSPEARAEAQALMDARSRLSREARKVVDERFEVFGKAATEAFMNDVVATRSIDRLGLPDRERMKAIVARMARRLAIRHSRRRKVRDRGRLDLRRTLRANAGNDGVPFQVVFRRKHRDKPKIIAICDVSGSVASYVKFLLMFLHALNETVTDLGAFAFSAELEDVSEDLHRRSLEKAMDRILFRLGDGSTDYGRAFETLRERYFDQIDRRTTVLILGDGRSNHGDPKKEILAEIADRAKRVVWLCPEPPGRWGRGDSEMLTYKPFCTVMLHCATAQDLEQALDDILVAYD